MEQPVAVNLNQGSGLSNYRGSIYLANGYKPDGIMYFAGVCLCSTGSKPLSMLLRPKNLAVNQVHRPINGINRGIKKVFGGVE